ncbi:FAD-dependent oxidoreductase [Pseudooceanicola sp. 216_PA32_1]|uniref:FAD-dependent oxidoreductase n=1 Tax=Pseudooceanicola pacificus TaxID=2676438 RepID=A0A844W1G4_9RHOB|nr:FAD-dependent tricarballylate dehydrogenase TcuA [Pseudooceanicola pacificus]MWB77956.1 FAD-dependent oxidoreductase [Pseudooceanicola pacificus]
MEEETTDVLVVGCGIAGLCAAVTALQQGARVTVLERAPKEDFGGNTRWTEAYMRMKNDAEIADDFAEHFMQNPGANLDPNVERAVTGESTSWPAYVRAHPMPDPEVIFTFADQVPSTISWLKEFGLKFGPQPIYLLTQNTHRIAAQGGGLALIERLNAEVEKLGGEILYETAAHDLIRSEDGTVCGGLCKAADGTALRIRAKSTVLASGGFQGNPEMMARYIGPRASYMRPVARGGYYNRGEGIRMALEAGAAPAGEFSSYHAEPVDPRSQEAEAVVFIYPYGILVNNRGRRFIDEAPGTVDAHYDNISRSFAHQPDGIAWVIFDDQVDDIPRWQSSIRSDIPPVEAPTIAALAEKLGLPVENLTTTVDDFNAACPEIADFTPFEIDNAATRGIEPPKSNWSRPLTRAPFRAYPLISSVCFTFGGLKVNNRAEVVDTEGRTIPGLLAAGETMGIYHQVYTGSTSVLRGAVFGRIAGMTATDSQK